MTVGANEMESKLVSNYAILGEITLHARTANVQAG
jgi:hypothetical protein